MDKRDMSVMTFPQSIYIHEVHLFDGKDNGIKFSLLIIVSVSVGGYR